MNAKDGDSQEKTATFVWIFQYVEGEQTKKYNRLLQTLRINSSLDTSFGRNHAPSPTK